MSQGQDKFIFKTRPFPPDHIFDPLRPFEPVGIHNRIKENQSGQNLDDIDRFFSKVSKLLRQVNSLSWLYHVWMKKFHASGTLNHQDKTMTAILLRMYSHIDTGKIFNPARDRPDSSVMATRTDDHTLGYTGFSLDDFNCVNRDKKSNFKKTFASVFKIWSYTTFKNVFLSPISGICETLYQSEFACILNTFLLRCKCPHRLCNLFRYNSPPQKQNVVCQQCGRLGNCCS